MLLSALELRPAGQDSVRAFDLLLRGVGPRSAEFYLALSQEVAVRFVKRCARSLFELEVVAPGLSAQLPLVVLLEPPAGQHLWVVGLWDWRLAAGWVFAVMYSGHLDSAVGSRLQLVSARLSVGKDFAVLVSESVELGSGPTR